MSCLWVESQWVDGTTELQCFMYWPKHKHRPEEEAHWPPSLHFQETALGKSVFRHEPCVLDIAVANSMVFIYYTVCLCVKLIIQHHDILNASDSHPYLSFFKSWNCLYCHFLFLLFYSPFFFLLYRKMFVIEKPTNEISSCIETPLSVSPSVVSMDSPIKVSH